MKQLRMALAAVAFMVSGCLTTTYNTGLPAGGEPVKTTAGTFYIRGWLGETDVNLSTLCPNGVATWKQYLGVVDVIIGGITCGLYDPATIEVTCSGGGAAKASFLLTPDKQSPEHRTLVQPLALSSAANGDHS